MGFQWDDGGRMGFHNRPLGLLSMRFWLWNHEIFHSSRLGPSCQARICQRGRSLDEACDIIGSKESLGGSEVMEDPQNHDIHIYIYDYTYMYIYIYISMSKSMQTHAKAKATCFKGLCFALLFFRVTHLNSKMICLNGSEKSHKFS